ncbi:MAG: hypothetical protein AAGA83_25910 [Cyanobacteria bacterium P01_F01_bin.116]
MKLGFTFNQIAILAVLSVGVVILSAVYSKYPGLIELRCNSDGCHVVIDGRSPDKTPSDIQYIHQIEEKEIQKLEH